MFEDLNLILEAIVSYMNQLTIIMFSNSLITIFVAIWAVRKVSKLLNIIH